MRPPRDPQAAQFHEFATEQELGPLRSEEAPPAVLAEGETQRDGRARGFNALNA